MVEKRIEVRRHNDVRQRIDVVNVVDVRGVGDLVIQVAFHSNVDRLPAAPIGFFNIAGQGPGKGHLEAGWQQGEQIDCSLMPGTGPASIVQGAFLPAEIIQELNKWIRSHTVADQGGLQGEKRADRTQADFRDQPAQPMGLENGPGVGKLFKQTIDSHIGMDG